jgi:GT2 family glycosyltransferase
VTQFPKVVVVLINWNREQDTIECIQSIQSSTYPNVSVLVVDNGSTEESFEILRKSVDQEIVIEAKANLGFTGGCNLGMEHALKQGADYIFLLNNDTVIGETTIELLVNSAEFDPRVGVVGPKIRFYQPENLVWFGGAHFRRSFLAARMVGYGIEDKGQFDTISDIPFASGCAALIKRQVIEKVGYLDDDYFAVMEDLDYSLRITGAGFLIRYIPQAVIKHKESVSSGGHNAPQYVYYQTRNSFLFRRKWSNNLAHNLSAMFYWNSYHIKRLIGFLLTGKWRSTLGLIYGVRDGIWNVTGRKEFDHLKQKRLPFLRRNRITNDPSN